MTREDIHEAAKNDEQDGVKPGGSGEPSQAGSGFGGVEADLNGADAVPENTTGVNNPGTPQQKYRWPMRRARRPQGGRARRCSMTTLFNDVAVRRRCCSVTPLLDEVLVR